MTCDRPDNPYTVPSALVQNPNGVRLDYIMYRANAGEFSAFDLDGCLCVADDYDVFLFDSYKNY